MWEIKTKQTDNKIGMRGMDFFFIKAKVLPRFLQTRFYITEQICYFSR